MLSLMVCAPLCVQEQLGLATTLRNVLFRHCEQQRLKQKVQKQEASTSGASGSPIVNPLPPGSPARSKLAAGRKQFEANKFNAKEADQKVKVTENGLSAVVKARQQWQQRAIHQ
eukprot:2921234-Pyramimonas_sp.AAC.4